MQSQFPHLMEPITVGKTIFRNRIFTAPIGLHSIQAAEPYPTEAAITHFANKARGGAACVTCGGVSIFPIAPDPDHSAWDVYTKSNLNYLAQLADRIHFYGARASMELGVAGVVGGDYGASAGITLMMGNIAKEMPESEMNRIADGYANAALGLKHAGFDMTLLHFGHGLLVGQFLSPLTNKRKDKYGGSLENRARFPMMIIDRIREKVGRDLLLEVRVSGTEFEPGGIRVEETIELVRLIQDRIDLIHVSAGMHSPKYMTVVHPCDFLPPMPNVFLAEAVKKAGVKIPVVTIGGIQELRGAEKILADGRADIVTVARGFIAEPDLAEKAREGRPDDVTPCIKCMRCHDSAVFEYHFICSVNPEIGLEHKLPAMVQPPVGKKRIAVIGGGPAGMKSALIAAERGHDVTLYEKSDSLGGTLKFSEKVAFKYDLARYKNFLVKQVEKSNIRLCLNTAATPETIEKEHYDAVLAALGSEPIVPPIPGIDGRNVISALASYGEEDRLPDRVAVIGGGQVGCETALHLGQLGKTVTILEMRSELAPDASVTHRTELLLEMEKCDNITVVTSGLCTGVTGSGVSYKTGDGAEKKIDADAVIIAAGMKPRVQEAEKFRGTAGRFVSIGDCEKVGTVEKATRNAFAAAVRL